jgi:hydroxyacylglutathione hydrolase
MSSPDTGEVFVERVEQPEWLTNSYLVHEGPGGKGILIDGNGRLGELVAGAGEQDVEITHLLLTHDHWDHVIDAGEVAAELGVPVLASPGTVALLDFPAEPLEPGETVSTGDLLAEAIDSPGHSDGHLAFLVNGTELFTGDTLFAGTIGGTMLPGRTGFREMRESVMDRMMNLPPGTSVHPGHSGPSTIGQELEENPFIRVWRGIEPEGSESCEVVDRGEATLILWAPDYDGTNKAWVRFPDGSEGIIGGSQVSRS